MISRIHIQTVDECNAHCVMCPYKAIPHSKKEIETGLFVHIINELESSIRKGLIAKEPEIYLFFNNEPLLDSKLFDRIRYIYNRIPLAKVILFTNAILIEDYKEELLQAGLHLLYISLYGYDHVSFEKVTGVHLGENKYASMVQSIEEVKEKINVTVSNSWENIQSGKPTLKKYSSRAGYYSGKVKHKKIKGCKHQRNSGWLNILDTGEIVLCCMDWKKESVLGNLKESSIEEIINSEQSKILYEKSVGIIESETDFICKRCEWAIPDYSGHPQKAKKKQLIITACSENKANYLIDFLISLRDVGQYHGEIVLLNYNLPFYVLEIANLFNVKIHNCSVSENYQIVNTRLLDVYNILLKGNYTDYQIALFDVDIWFNRNIDELFFEINNIEGCYYAAEYRPGFYKFGKGRGPGDDLSEKENLEKMTKVVSEFKGHLNAGFMGGRFKPFYNKLNLYLSKTMNGYNVDIWGIDQYLYNLMYDFEKDNAHGKRWNCVLNDINIHDGKLVINPVTKPYPEYPDVPNAVHCYGVFDNEKQTPFRFQTSFPEVFKSGMIQLLENKVHEVRNLYENTVECKKV